MGYKDKQAKELQKAVKEGKVVKKKEKRETSEERKAREEREDEEWEKECENYCARGITLMMMASPLWSLLSFIGEWAARVPMIVDEADMTGQRAIITGGCDGMGLELASLMVVAGASVVLACRDAERAEEAVRTVQLGLHHSQLDNVQTMPLDLESLASVREFAEKYVDTIGSTDGLNVLVNNAGTANACNTTEDGNELAFQVNYLGHFLLTDLLLPTIKASAPARIVHVTCEAANDAKIDISNLDGLGNDVEPTRCLQEKQYGVSKIAQITHSNELERRLRAERKKDGNRGPAVVSHAINPGSVASEFFNKAPAMAVSGRQSMRTKMLMYFPPFRMMAWLMSGVKDLIVNAMTRSTMRGATGRRL
jgi:NAD(P)-dependent dehydrogenase (short-subunit alcohol dehydrogenase family)